VTSAGKLLILLPLRGEFALPLGSSKAFPEPAISAGDVEHTLSSVVDGEDIYPK
jgi:hypothetical protein